MTRNTVITPRLLALAQRMADRAGDIARRYFQSGMAVDHKADESPVTAADREIETALRALIEADFSEHGIVGEEFGNVRPASPLQWVLDPIDGTHAFIEGKPTFTTLIALVENNIPILGVIDQPVTRERWVGIAGQTTTLNAAPVHTRACATLAQASIATTAMRYFTPEQAGIFEKLRSKCGNVTFGGDAYLYAGLASGKPDIVVEAGLKPYDFCALAPVIEGAGGVITDWQGKKLTLQSDGRVLAAATKELHAQALTLLPP